MGLMRPPLRRAELDSLQGACTSVSWCASHASVPEADRPRRLADFDGLPLIMYAPDKARYFHDLLTGLFASARAEPQLVQHLAQIHSILMLVGAGHGFALVPETSTRLHPDDVVFSPLDDARSACRTACRVAARQRQSGAGGAAATLRSSVEWTEALSIHARSRLALRHSIGV